MVTIKLNNLCGRRFVDRAGGTCKTLSLKKNGGGLFVLVSRDDGRRYSNNYHKIFYYLISK